MVELDFLTYEFSGFLDFKNKDSSDSRTISLFNDSTFEITEFIEQKIGQILPDNIKVQSDIRFYESSKCFAGTLFFLNWAGSTSTELAIKTTNPFFHDALNTVLILQLSKVLDKLTNKLTKGDKKLDRDSLQIYINRIPEDIREFNLRSIWINSKNRSRNYLPFGQDYDREISYIGKPFKIYYPSEIRAWSRIKGSRELLCVINTNSKENRGADIVVDSTLNSTGARMSPVAIFDLKKNIEHKKVSLQPAIVNQTSDGKHFVSVRDLHPYEMIFFEN